MSHLNKTKPSEQLFFNQNALLAPNIEKKQCKFLSLIGGIGLLNAKDMKALNCLQNVLN